MSKAQFAAVLSAVLLVVPAASAMAQVVGEDSVTGASAPPGSGNFFVFDAHSGPSGENARGTVRFVITQGSEAVFTVSCLAVNGTRATIGTTLGIALHFYVEDNDGAGADRYSFGGPSVIDCTSPPPPSNDPDWVVSNGDLTVTDAHPFPTSMDQCKNGGWRNFPGFKNQGDCVSFVATGGKNPPAG